MTNIIKTLLMKHILIIHKKADNCQDLISRYKMICRKINVFTFVYKALNTSKCTNILYINQSRINI